MSLQTLEIIGYIGTGVIVFLFGITIGSFLNVCIYRLPKGESLTKKNSHCMSCGEEIKRYDLIPIFSWLILRGKCRACGAKISPRYMLVEALTGMLFVLAFMKYDTIQFGYYFVILCLFFAGLIVICFEDFDTQNMSVSVLLYLFAIAAIQRAAQVLLPKYFRYQDVSLTDGLIGMVSVSIPFLIFGFVITPLVYSFFISEDCKAARKLKGRISRMKNEKASDKEIEKIQKILDKHLLNIKETGPVYGFGMGDIILMGAGGLLLGWKASVTAAFAAILIGAVYGLVRKHLSKEENNAFAFGPFLTMGLAFAVFFGNDLFNAYVNFITVPKV